MANGESKTGAKSTTKKRKKTTRRSTSATKRTTATRGKTGSARPAKSPRGSAARKTAKKTPSGSQGMTGDQLRAMIAEAAYFKAERRGFRGGDPERDWREAEAEIEARFLKSPTD